MSITSTDVGMHAINNSWSSGSPAHSGITDDLMLQLAKTGGSSIVRVPLDLSIVTASGPPQYAVDYIGGIMQIAQNRGLKLVLEPGQTPPDLIPTGAPLSTAPSTDAELYEMGRRFGLLVEAVHSQYAQFADTVLAWEVGNEPNLSFQNDGSYYGGGGDPSAPRYYVVDLSNADHFATLVHAAQQAVDNVEQTLGQTIKVMSGGIAHNDYFYFERFLEKLAVLNADIDGFSVHPYTTHAQDAYQTQSPESGRATDWVPNYQYDGAWPHYHSFQGAIYGTQQLLTYFALDDADLWITEFGVPSYLGYRNAGALGSIDQAYWYAEALGVLDSWGNSNLKGVIAHNVLDLYFSDQNAYYNAYDGNGSNDGSAPIAEGSFGLYERLPDGSIVAKPTVNVFNAIVNGLDFSDQSIRFLNFVSTDNVDISAYGSNGAGIVEGYVVLTNGGNDTVTGSAYSDSIFLGEGDDSVDGGAGDDRLYGGPGSDLIVAGAGDDDLYGNAGNDSLDPGSGSNRVDGGTGLDTLILPSAPGSYAVTGDGAYFTVSRNGSSDFIAAQNVERITFGDGSVWDLPNGNTSAGNGGVGAAPPGTQKNRIDGTAGDDVLNGTNGEDAIYGWGGNDSIFALDEDDDVFAGDGNDNIWPGYGTNVIDGGADADTVHISGLQSDFNISLNGQTVQVGGAGVWNLLTNVEYIAFDDGSGTTSVIEVWTLFGASQMASTSDDGLFPSPGGGLMPDLAASESLFGLRDNGDAVPFFRAMNDRIVFDDEAVEHTIIGQNDNYMIMQTRTGDFLEFIDTEYAEFANSGPVSLEDIVGSDDLSPYGSWFNPEPIGGLI